MGMALRLVTLHSQPHTHEYMGRTKQIWEDTRKRERAGEVGHQKRVLAPIAKDLDSVSRTTWWLMTACNFSSRGSRPVFCEENVDNPLHFAGLRVLKRMVYERQTGCPASSSPRHSFPPELMYLNAWMLGLWVVELFGKD